MYLRRIELQGFKTFAAKTVLEFSPESSKRRGTTGVVGPNGSGKSNIADAIRWVMGEQSMKLLRGKKAEDLIFSGSQKKARSGFAEVSMTLVNDTRKEDLDFSEMTVTRRLYRDGKSEFEINRRPAKLGDVTMLFAQAGIGQRTYSVIGQGMADSVLSASPAERKEFFDEAAGLRPFQLKRHQSVTKLQTSKERLAQAEVLLREIAPRLTALQRQVKRLEQRAELEAERAELETQYYGGMWHDLFGRISETQALVERARAEERSLMEEAKALEAELLTMEKAVPPSKGFEQLRMSLDSISEQRASLRERQTKLEAKIEIAKAKAEVPHVPLSLGNIIVAVEESQKHIEELLKLVESEVPDLEKIRSLIARLHVHHKAFTTKLQKPAPEQKPKVEIDPAINAELASIASDMQALADAARDVQSKIAQWDKAEEGKRAHLFETQRGLNAKREAARSAERKASEAAIELARWETKRDGFLSELRLFRSDLEPDLNALAQRVGTIPNVQEFLPKLQRVRSQLEWIGSIDPETQKEYTETKERFDFLNGQVEDLRGAIHGLDTVIRELDETIRKRSEVAFHTLNSAFAKTFKSLFGGGEAKLLQIAPEPVVDEEGNVIPPPPDAPAIGIEIQATPPGKKLKSIALLSGGERALTSIALISAIMATNPSPFIVLDEVDAALDEVNTKKFADILDEHATHTQFIVVTHNRTTMHQAGVLYGVTLTEEGISRVLSVKLSEVSELKGISES